MLIQQIRKEDGLLHSNVGEKTAIFFDSVSIEKEVRCLWAGVGSSIPEGKRIDSE